MNLYLYLSLFNCKVYFHVISDVDTDEVDTDSDADEPLAKKKKTEKGSKEEEDDSEGEWQDVEHSSDEEVFLPFSLF